MTVAGRFTLRPRVAAAAVLLLLGSGQPGRAAVDTYGLIQAGVRVELPLDSEWDFGLDTLRITEPSARKAFFLSFVLPGAGHRYVNGGRWSGKATAFAAADAVFWMRLVGANWRASDLEASYRTLAALHAGAQVDGKGRPFFVQLGGYASSDEYVAFLLRARAWNRIDEASLPENHWNWDSEDARLRYRSLRQDTDKMDRRRTWMTAALVANRFVSALSALRFARSHRAQGTVVEIRFLPVAPGEGLAAHVRLRW